VSARTRADTARSGNGIVRRHGRFSCARPCRGAPGAVTQMAQRQAELLRRSGDQENSSEIGFR